MKKITYWLKKATGIALTFMMLLILSNTTYAAEITEASTAGSVQEIKAISYNNDNSGKLLDSVILYMDTNGNFRNANEITTNSWFTDNVIVMYNFYDMGLNWSGGQRYEVQMSAAAIDLNGDIYFTKHILQVKPKNNTNWLKSEIKHSLIDYKTSIGDAIQYAYPGEGPSNPTVQVKGSYTLSGYGTFSTPTVTLSKPIS